MQKELDDQQKKVGDKSGSYTFIELIYDVLLLIVNSLFHCLTQLFQQLNCQEFVILLL